VLLKVFDATGRLVATLIDKNILAGEHTVTFDASGIASGTYFVSLQAGDYRASKKMTVVK